VVRNVLDKTGRFRERPHYDPSELDIECQGIITSFLKSLYGAATYPVSTEDLTKLIDRDTSDFDRYADLSDLGTDVEGVTDFLADRKPVVRISRVLSEDGRQENRLRTTLTHEYGHVKFHAYLFATQESLAQLHGMENQRASRCNRDSLLEAPATDWMEWQAGYVCGSLLMPLTEVKHTTGAFLRKHDLFAPLQVGWGEASALISTISGAFQVSADAARVRLSRLDYLTATAVTPSLFRGVP
jgi:hypothetical protein